MRVLELFAGARCIGQAAELCGHEVFSVDWTGYEGIDLVKDINTIEPKDIPWIPDHIHASFDCTTYTIAAISHHRNGTEPKSDYAKFCDEVNLRVLKLINYYKAYHNYKITFSIENPRGMLRKMPFMQGLPRYTVWYCQYGDDRAKPTDIWTNLNWKPKPVCHNGNKNCHHQPAPRGSKTGTQGRKGSHQRSLMPEELCLELMCCLPLYNKKGGTTTKQVAKAVKWLGYQCDERMKLIKPGIALPDHCLVAIGWKGPAIDSGLRREVAAHWVAYKKGIIICSGVGIYTSLEDYLNDNRGYAYGYLEIKL